MKRPTDLPDFSEPPVTEVYLSLQFEPIKALKPPYLGLFWAKLEKDFPVIEERPPIMPVTEDFGQPKPPRISLNVVQPDQPIEETSRFWFLKSDGTELVQIQQDRFIHNWRKTVDTDVYPRYEQIRETYRSGLEQFMSFLSSRKIGSIVPTQCEVVYVNHIVPSTDTGWSNLGEIGHVLSTWKSEYSDVFLGNPEDVFLNARYRIFQHSSPIGRLHVNVQPAVRAADQRPMLVMTLTARGILPEGDRDRVFGFFDIGREWIVRAFASSTTPEMHRVWKRQT